MSAREGLTRVGEVVGTPEYMSPEQACGEAVDGRSDLYSLGLVLWFAATGQTAMAGESTQRVLARQLGETLPPVASLRTDLPAPLADAIDRCVAKEPSARFADAAALAAALDDAELAAPEVPLPIRAVANELRTLGLVTILGGALASFLAYRTAAKGGERAFEAVWLGPFGRAFLRRALRVPGHTMGGGFTGSAGLPVASRDAGELAAGRGSGTPAAPITSEADQRLARLEERVDLLERVIGDKSGTR